MFVQIPLTAHIKMYDAVLDEIYNHVYNHEITLSPVLGLKTKIHYYYKPCMGKCLLLPLTLLDYDKHSCIITLFHSRVIIFDIF